jgi:glycosyltransferase involved in cell wall biosynthesis
MLNINKNFRMLAVLVISPHPDVQGGVSGFVEAMKKTLQRCYVTSLYVGRPGQGKEGLFAMLKRFIRMVDDITLLVGANDYDVIHINPSLNYKSLIRDGFILFLLRLLGARNVMVFFHGWDWKVFERIQSQRYLRRMFVWLLDYARCIMVLAPEFGQALFPLGISSDKVFYTVTMFDGEALRANAPAQKERRMVLFMSRLEKKKGVYELVNAFANAAADFPDVDMVIAGDGREYNDLRALVTSRKLDRRIKFTGFVSGEEKAQLLVGCDVFALPTYHAEGLPVVLLEAMGAGKVLLTSNAGGIRHIVHEPDNGAILEKVSVEAVETALRRLLSDQDYCRNAGKRNAIYAWEHFEAHAVTPQIEAIYNAL